MLEKRLAAIALSLLLLLSAGIPAWAADVEDEYKVGYYVRAIRPENQIDQRVTYFDLRMKPGQEQILEVEVVNRAAQDIEVEVKTTSACTNRNGFIEYNVEHEPDESLLVCFTDISSVAQDTLRVPAQGSAMAQIAVTMPKAQFDGELLGGLVFTKKNIQPDADDMQVIQVDESKSIALENRYHYVLAVRLTETDNPVAPALECADACMEVIAKRPYVVHNIRNSAPALVDGLTMNIGIYPEGQDEPLIEQRGKAVKMAPNSVMSYALQWTDGQMPAGNYTSRVSLQSAQGDAWEFETPFVIEQEHVAQAGEYLATLEQRNIPAQDPAEQPLSQAAAAYILPWWVSMLLILLAAAVIVIAVLAMLLRKRRAPSA